jgi:CDP-diglyceride synthetase
VKGSQLAAALGVTEYAGMAFVVGAAVARALVGEVWMGVLAVALGAALAGWGAVTKVRRRAFVGAGTVVVSLVLMIVVPIGRYLGQQPRLLEGATLWIIVAAMGLVALLVAAFLERGRARVQQFVRRINDLTADWE